MNKLDLTTLLERVRNAVGSSIELDQALSEAFGERNAHGVLIVADRWLGIAPFTSSIDAALALVEHVAGGQGTWSMVYSFDLSWHASAHAHMAYTADMFVADGDPCVMLSYQAQSYTLPLAILTALLLALTSNQEGNDEEVR